MTSHDLRQILRELGEKSGEAILWHLPSNVRTLAKLIEKNPGRSPAAVAAENLAAFEVV